MNQSATQPDPEPRFDVHVPRSGYHWWYVDGISDDGQNGIVIIAFIGSVFSPYYFRARSKGPADPLDYCAINVGLYRRRGKLWAMTERGRQFVSREASLFRVGPSQLRWTRDRLIVDVDERTTPFAQRIAGRIEVHPAFLNDRLFALDGAERHVWRPVAPVGRIEVQLDRPALTWAGDAYLDMNQGSRALEEDFAGWNWSRHGNRRGTSITYAADLIDGSERALALDFDQHGNLDYRSVPPRVTLPGTGWRVGRQTHSTTIPVVRRTLEDTPFYARSILESGGPGEATTLTMHESLSLTRFRSLWVRSLLPFRMPRIAGPR